MTIPTGRRVVLDVTPTRLASLAVDGSLRFADRIVVAPSRFAAFTGRTTSSCAGSSRIQTNVASGKTYEVRFAGNVPPRMRVAAHGFSDGDVIRVSF